MESIVEHIILSKDGQSVDFLHIHRDRILQTVIAYSGDSSNNELRAFHRAQTAEPVVIAGASAMAR
jgi:hypothetical protein